MKMAIARVLAWLLKGQLTLFLSLFAVMALHKFQVLHFSLFSPLLLVLVVVMMLLAFVALIFLVFALIKAWNEYLMASMAVVVLALLPIFLTLFTVGSEALSVPAIHDISTDLESPPVFVAAKADRHPKDHSTVYGGEGVASLQRKGYPDLEPLVLDVSLSEAFDRVRAVVELSEWRVLRIDEQERVIEAVASTKLLGYQDDVIVRVSPVREGSRIDVRSASRVGVSDMGANAKRIFTFLARVER